MSEDFLCPRRAECGFAAPEPDTWRVNPNDGCLGAGRRACSYCGSAHPEDVFKAIEDGQQLGPTDKNYKVYVGDDGSGSKFYFQHFDEAQRRRFVDLLNDGKIKIDFPGRFYVLPFFCSRKTA